MLASFKQNAAASSSASKRPPSSRNSSSTIPNEHNQQTRKRPHPKSDNGNNMRSTPYFPSLHSVRKNKGGFELSFLVIGAQKAGTSWMHTLLQKCNCIALPRGQKEVHFWDWHFRKGFDWYIHQFGFPRRSSSHTAVPSSKTKHPIYGEITPCYIVLPPPAIAEIHNCFPGIKLVFVARDLVDRAWSAIIMELRDQTMGLNPGEFAEGIIPGDKQVASEGSKRARKSKDANMSVVQQRRLQQQSSPSSQPDSYYLDRLQSETHTSRSDYATHLGHWLTHFQSKNMLLVDYREIETNSRGVLLKVVMHLGLEEEDAKAYVNHLNEDDVRQRVNAATNTKLNGALPNTTTSHHALSQRPRLRKQFEQYLRPYATKFNLLLKKEGYSWQLNDYTD